MPLRAVAGIVRPARMIIISSSRQAPTQARQYTCTAIRGYPTAIARAERAADLKKHPESALTQQKLDDKKGNRHWSEDNATLSEADIRADHEAEAEKAKKDEKKDEKGTQ